MRLHRLFGILLLMESRGTIKACELAEAFETSERTIYRDIEILCESGVPIRSDFGPNGGFSLMDRYTLNSAALHCDEVVSLYLCGIGIHPARHSDASVNLKNSSSSSKKASCRLHDDLRIARSGFISIRVYGGKSKNRLNTLICSEGLSGAWRKSEYFIKAKAET